MVVREPRPYTFVDARTCASVTGPTRARDYRCNDESSSFLVGEQVHLWAKFEGIDSGYQYLVKTYQDGKLIKQSKSEWHSKSKQPVSSYLVTHQASGLPGEYRSEFFINVGRGFEKVSSKSYRVEVLSPVAGEVRRQCYWPEGEDEWAFCPHVQTGRRSSRGIALANDTAAWDVNLRDYEDAGKQVYPVAPGKIVKYGNQTLPGEGDFAGVLVEHQAADGKRWWSGYLHMKRDSIHLHEGQEVDIDSPLGVVGRTGTSNSHLHVVIYKGENQLGALKSFETSFRSRTDSELERVARQRIFNPDEG